MNSKDISFETTLKNLREFDGRLNEVCTQYVKVHVVLKEFFQVLQKIPFSSFCEKIFKNKCFEESVSSILESLSVFINCPQCPVETALLSGACLNLLIFQVFGMQKGYHVLLYFINIFAETARENNCDRSEVTEEQVKLIHLESKCKLREVISSVVNDCCTENKNYGNTFSLCTPLKNELGPNFSQFAVLYGTICCLKSEVILDKSDLQNNKHIFSLKIFHLIHNFCVTNHNFKYHALQVVLSWVKLQNTILQNISRFPNSCQIQTEKMDIIFLCYIRTVKSILQILEANWENSAPGVLDTVRDIYKALIEVPSSESLPFKNKTLLSDLLKSTMDLSWEVKGKYIVLSAILCFMDYKEYLLKYPLAPYQLIQNMSSKYISSVSSVVYMTLVKSIKNSSKMDFVKEWKTWWSQPVFSVLASCNRAVLQNVTNHILPRTAKEFPQFYTLIEDSHEFTNIQDDAVLILLLRISRENGFSLQHKDVLRIEKNLHHKNEIVRIDIFTLLCSSPKKTEALSLEFIHLIKDFLTINMNIDSPEFHHRLITQVKELLVRIRVSTSHLFSKESIENPNSNYMLQIEFIEWLAQTAFKNTFPGACYQRRRLCIQLLDLIFKVFLSQSLNMKKGKFSVKFNEVIKEAQRAGLWKFLSDDSILKVLPLLTDYTEEIRVFTAKLLEDHWLQISSSNVKDMHRVARMLSHALTIANSPHPQYRDCGILLCKIIFKKCVVHHQLAFDFDHGTFIMSQYNEQSVLNFLQNLANIATKQLLEIKADFLKAARLTPVHGILSVLHHCLYIDNSFFPMVYKSSPGDSYLFLENTVNLCGNVVNYVLSSMMRETERDAAPSFEDMSVALENMMCEENEDSSSAAEFQLLLSCCWNCIKESCVLLSHVGELILLSEIPDNLSARNLIQKISDILLSVLLKSRLRGAIESCKTALTKLCQALLKKHSRLSDIPTTLLNQALSVISAPSSTSVTRRSAGFPLLVLSVVAAEHVHQDKKLLHLALKKSVSIISSPVGFLADDKTDVPQAHAFHILRALFVSTRLSSDVMSWLDQILPLCVSGFSSTSWSVCNGALQLFGVLLPYLCGQKKVRDDDSEHNLISPLELFSRCQKLYQYILYQLQKSTYLHREGRSCPELIPLLTLLTKLHPDGGICDKNWKLVAKFKPSLICLLGSPVWKIRCLASSSVSAFTETRSALDEIEILIQLLSQRQNVSANFTHGVLLTVQKIINSRHGVLLRSDICRRLLMLIKKLSWLLEYHSCAIIQIVYFKIIFDVTSHMSEKERLENMMPFVQNHSSCVTEPAYTLWKKNYISWYLELSSSHPQDIKKILYYLYKDPDCLESCFEFIRNNCVNQKINLTCTELWESIVGFIAELITSWNHHSILHQSLKFIIFYCCNVMASKKMYNSLPALHSEHFQTSVLNLTKKERNLYVAGSAFSVLSWCLKSSLRATSESFPSFLESWIVSFYQFAHPKNSEVLKLEIAKSVASVGPDVFYYFPFWIKSDCDTAIQNIIMFFEALLFLLEDETEEIRDNAVMFFANIPHNFGVTVPQCNAAISVIYQLMEDLLLSHDYYVHYLLCRFQSYPSSAKIVQACSFFSKQSLFDQEIINVYAEPAVHILLLSKRLKVALEQLYLRNISSWNEIIRLHAQILYHEMEEVKEVFCCMSENFSRMSGLDSSCEPGVFLLLHKLYCFRSVITAQKPFLPAKSEVVFYLEKMESITQNIQQYVPSFQNWNYILSDLSFVSEDS